MIVIYLLLFSDANPLPPLVKYITKYKELEKYVSMLQNENYLDSLFYYNQSCFLQYSCKFLFLDAVIVFNHAIKT